MILSVFRKNRTTEAFALVVLSMFCFALLTTSVRWLSLSGMGSTQAMLLRNGLSVGIAYVWGLSFFRDHRFLRTTRLRQHAARAGIGFLAMQCWFLSLSLLPVTLATALSFTTPIFATLLAMLILGERAGWRRWTAIACGFVGVVIILNPDASQFNPSVLIVLLASALMASSSVVVKTLARDQSPETIVFYMSLFMTPLSMPLGIWHWQPVTAHQWLAVAIVALTSTLAHLSIARAYQRAQMVALLPFDFLRLLFAAGMAALLFDEALTWRTALGASVIVASTVYIAWREAQLHKRKMLAELKEVELNPPM